MIEEFKIGSFKIKGKRYIGDIKIIDGKVRYWEHRYKQILREDDVSILLESNPEVIVIGTGCGGLLEVPDNVKNLIRSKRIAIVIEKTPEACKKFNNLISENKKVAAILHSTG